MAKDPQKSTPDSKVRFKRTRDFFERNIATIKSGTGEWWTKYKENFDKPVESRFSSRYLEDPMTQQPMERFDGTQEERVVPLPSKENVIKYGTKFSMWSTFLGFSSSTLTAFNGVFDKFLSKKIPFNIHRASYNIGSSSQAGVRGYANDPSLFSDQSAVESAKWSQIFNLMSVASAFGVTAMMLRKTPGLMLAPLSRYANSSAGFNLTGILNLIGAGLLLDASTKEARYQEDQLVKSINKITGLSEEESRKIVKEVMPHMTQDEIVSRNLGLTSSFVGSATGLMSAVVTNPIIASRLSIISGVAFGLGLALPLFSFANSSQEARFSDEKNKQFLEVQEMGFKALIPALTLTIVGGVVLRRFPSNPYLQQLPIHGLHKCDNSFAISSMILSGGVIGISPLAWREFYAQDQRNADIKRVIGDFMEGKDFSEVENSHTKKLLERAAESQKKKSESVMEK